MAPILASTGASKDYLANWNIICIFPVDESSFGTYQGWSAGAEDNCVTHIDRRYVYLYID